MEEALAYIDLGWSVFPLLPRSKKPAVTHGVKDATDCADDVREWWEKHPDHNVAIACGEASGELLVIDLDVSEEKGKDGLAVVREWERVHGALTTTAMARTGSGGCHILYKAGESVGNHVNQELGVDIRSDGGFIVAPPSVHPNGNRYTWVNDPREVGVAQVDDNVMAFIEHVTGKGKEKKSFELPDGDIAEGGRNDMIFKLAASLQSRGESDESIMQRCFGANLLKCCPPLPEDEVRKTVESALGYDKGGGDQFATPEKIEEYGLQKTGHGKVTNTSHNAALVINGEWPGQIWLNELSGVVMLKLPAAWDAGKGSRPMNDNDASHIRMVCEQFGIGGRDKVSDAIDVVAKANARNELMEWLEGLEWDGQKRLENLLPGFLGAPKTQYTAEAMLTMMHGAILRAKHPGAKFDYMMVLMGPQGIGKSYFIRSLAREDDWFCDNLNTMEGDKAIEKVRGRWFVEAAELQAMKRGDNETIKGFISAQSDTYRQPYARYAVTLKRSCVFIGTTNDTMFLSDATGGRRFLPIQCTKPLDGWSLFEDWAGDYFEQAWAEAMHMYRMNGAHVVLSKHSQAVALAMQGICTEDDPRVGIIDEYLESVLRAAADPAGVRVCAMEIIDNALGDAYAKKAREPKFINEVHMLMKTRPGWVLYGDGAKKLRCREYGKQRCYVPTEAKIKEIEGGEGAATP